MLVWKFALLLFLSSLKIAHIKEHLWAIRSRRSLKKSDCKQIALDFFKKCEVSNSLVIWANRSKQWVICSKKHIFVCFWQFSPLFMPKSDLLTLLFAQSLFTKERPRAIRSLPSRQKSDGGYWLFFTSQLLFRSQKTSNLFGKTDEQISNPEFMCNRYCTSVL